MREMVAANVHLSRLTQNAYVQLVLWPVKKALFTYAIGVALVCFNFLRFEIYWKVRAVRFESRTLELFNNYFLHVMSTSQCNTAGII